MSIGGTKTVIMGGLALALVQGCDQSTPTALAPEVELDLALCSPAAGGFNPFSSNPYFPIQVSSQWIYEGEETGELIELQVTVLNETEVVGGITTRVIEERESIDGELSEVSRNFYAQASDGTVCYFGEDVDFYEGGEIVSHEGSWRADDTGNRPGIIMPANPHPGMNFQMEDAPGIAEDEGTIVGTESAEVPAGSFMEAIRIREFNPLDGDVGFKVFAAGVGLVKDGPIELIEYSP